MRIRTSSILGMTLAFSLTVGPAGPEANATTVVAYSFSGTLQAVTGLPDAVVGDVIKGSFAYDSSQAGSASTGLYTFTGSSKVHTFSFEIFNSSNQQIFSDSYTGDSTVATGGLYTAQVTYNGTAGTDLNLEGDTLTKYDGGHGTTGAAYDLTMNNPTSQGPAGGYAKPDNLVLPTTSIINSYFNLTSGTLTWDPPSLYFTTDNLVFSGAGVPEPSGLVLAALGLSTCAVASGLVRRRSAPRS